MMLACSSTLKNCHIQCYSYRGDWKRETWHRETIKIVEADIARLDNSAPYRKGGHRETWQPGTMSPSLISHFQCVTPWCRGKRLNCMWKCSNKYNSWCRNSHRRAWWWTLRGRQWRDFSYIIDCVKLLCRPSALLLLRFHPLTHTRAVDGVCSWIMYEYMTMLSTLILTVFARA